MREAHNGSDDLPSGKCEGAIHIILGGILNE